jgi:Tol biopolymer transport system component
MSFEGTPDEFLSEVLALPRVVAQSVAPDLARVAFSWAGRGDAIDVWVTPVDGTAGPVRITDSPDDSFVVGWMPDGKAVLVAEDSGGDERTRLYAVDIDPPHARRLLTDATPGYFLRGGRMTPDGRFLVVVIENERDERRDEGRSATGRGCGHDARTSAMGSMPVARVWSATICRAAQK